MNTNMNWLLARTENVEQDVRRPNRGFNIITRYITRLMIIGVILNVVASYFYPDFPERFPVIYGWFDGWLQFGEFTVKAVLYGIYSFFTGHWSEFWIECKEAFQELLQQFINWLSTIHF